jgi:hypothetical protein
MPVIPATRKAVDRRIVVKAGLGKNMGPYLKNN